MYSLYHHSVNASELKRFGEQLGYSLAPDTDRRHFAANYVGADSDGQVIAVEDG